VLFGLVLRPAVAHADDDGHRIGLTIIAGGGGGGVIHPGPLPGPIGFTDLGVEAIGEIRPWGGFLRADYLSSGDGGRWTTWAFAGGTEYRLFGDARHTALFLRGGLAFEVLSGNDEGCPVVLFVPSSCNLTGAPASTYSVTAETIGLIGGVRLELPFPRFFVAFSANFVPTVAVASQVSGTSGDNAGPSGTLELRFDLEAGFRDLRRSDPGDRSPVRSRRPANGIVRYEQ
jgi:hypothetical protein